MKTQITVRIDKSLHKKLLKFKEDNAYATMQDMFEDMIRLHLKMKIVRIEKQLIRSVVTRSKNPRMS